MLTDRQTARQSSTANWNTKSGTSNAFQKKAISKSVPNFEYDANFFALCAGAAKIGFFSTRKQHQLLQ
jgi:hypothetical protein